jgi:hypothetical protein
LRHPNAWRTCLQFNLRGVKKGKARSDGQAPGSRLTQSAFTGKLPER